MARERQSPDEPVMIKKYANRRLYNTQTSTYVTLDDLCDLVKEGYEFVVVDAKSGDDLTKSVLTQIIFEQEAKGANMLPISFLRNLISFYDDGIKEFVPPYLESTMQTFLTNQEQMREMLGMGNKANPMVAFEEISKQNLDIFTKTMEVMFSPFGENKKK